MGKPRASKKVVSSDEDETPNGQQTWKSREEDASEKKTKQGKLQRVTRGSTASKAIPKSGHTAPPSGSFTTEKQPPKPKRSPAKGRSAAKDENKTTGKPISLFFNAASQRQPPPSSSPDKPTQEHTPADEILDGSGDEAGSGLQLAKGSSTAIALRKRRAQQGESSSSLPPPASQKFLKASSGERVPSLSVFNQDKRPWTEQFAPKDLSELAVHKRKVADVRQWLETALNGHRQKVLVLKGAAGTGKTTTLQLLARDLGLDITEWRNPAGPDLTSEGTASTATQFEDFVGRAGKSGGLQLVSDTYHETHVEQRKASNNDAQMLLIEEFPNTFSRTSTTLQSFRSTLMQHLSAPIIQRSRPVPIVMIISETLLSTNTALADSFTAHRLLGPELQNHPFLDTIEFNAVAPTIITKALEAAVVKEARKSGRRKTPGPHVLKHIAECGDIRSAISSLEFLCLRGDEGDWSSKVTFTKPKKAKADQTLSKSETDALKLISNRESTLGIFHAVGKVVYNKRIASSSIAHPPAWLPQHRRPQVPENHADELIEELGTDVSTFIAALHENYALSCTSKSTEDALDSLTGCLDYISDADLLSIDRFSSGTRAFTGSAIDSMRQDEMAFQSAVRGLQFNLPSPVHRSANSTGANKQSAHRMFYPVSLRLWKQREEVQGTLDLLAGRYQAGDWVGTSPASAGALGGSASGVAGWRSSGSAAQAAPDAPIGSNASAAKTELLLESLPYASQILAARKTSSTLVDQLDTVTRVGNSAHVDDDEDAEDDDNAVGNAWSTDRPEGEGASRAGRGREKQNTGLKQVHARPGGGVPLPVESNVERLVLEDDDIVD